jgi:deazaflavin-dependent oxidoreductase (nitroreductase family)
MSDADAAAIGSRRRDWVSEHRAMYLRSGGAEGHIMDLVPVNGLPFSSHCLIRYKGRKSGRTLITGLCHGIIGGEVAICASKGGADTHPTWYLNILASETIDFQIATQAWRASWREPEAAERQKVWNYMVDCFPFYATYQKSTTRILPLVLMKAIEPVPVFTEQDAQGDRQY